MSRTNWLHRLLNGTAVAPSRPWLETLQRRSLLHTSLTTHREEPERSRTTMDPYRNGIFGGIGMTEDGINYPLVGLGPRYGGSTPKPFYRVRRDDGAVASVDKPSFEDYYVDLFSVYLPGRYETERAAREAAAKYAEQRAKILSKAAVEHAEWLRDRAPQHINMGDTVSFVGTPDERYLRGMLGTIIGVKRVADDQPFEYLVRWPGKGPSERKPTWLPQYDLMVRERAKDAGATKPAPAFVLDEK